VTWRRVVISGLCSKRELSEVICFQHHVSDRAVGARDRSGSDHCDQPIRSSAPMHQRREVRVGRRDDEFVVFGGVVKSVDCVEYQVDVRAALALLGQRRAIHDPESGARPEGAVARKSRGIQVTVTHQEPSCKRDSVESALVEVGNPTYRIGCEPLGQVGIKIPQSRIDVIEINE
jgi:hypothetical protein